MIWLAVGWAWKESLCPAVPAPPVHDDLVQREFAAEMPNQLWLSDSTEHRGQAVRVRDQRCVLQPDRWLQHRLTHEIPAGGRQTQQRGGPARRRGRHARYSGFNAVVAHSPHIPRRGLLPGTDLLAESFEATVRSFSNISRPTLLQEQSTD